jgi:hypothetical protein
MTRDVSNPEELFEFDSLDWHGQYEGCEQDEQLVREQRSRLEQIFGLPFTFEGRFAFQDGNMLCSFYAPEACHASGSFGDYSDLGLLSFSFSNFGRLFTVVSASQHPAVTPDRVIEATNIFRELGFLYCPDSILRTPYPPLEGMPFPTWGHRYFSSAI